MDDQNFDKQTAQTWIHAVEQSGPSFRDVHVYPKLNRMIELLKPKAILDIGCGQGICCEKINLVNCEYTGVEPSRFLLERAEQLYLRDHRCFLLGNAYALPVSDWSFDLAFSILVWHLLLDLEKAASEMARVLKTGSRFLIISANPEGYDGWKCLYPDVKITGKRLEGTMQLGEALSHDVLYLHSFNELTDALEKAGLTIESSEAFLPAKNSAGEQLLISIEGRKV